MLLLKSSSLIGKLTYRPPGAKGKLNRMYDRLKRGAKRSNTEYFRTRTTNSERSERRGGGRRARPSDCFGPVSPQPQRN
ncbi:hypothetical protein EVAR_61991_1 [Eumeta japonica]|uniref:Uncharacterized protein n=1 Tax=Eumeta variegata TaxID=151549 RepID=A0A4C1YHM9_EUMVA|nr:hypothetical protein EVAR_61991_1 [Eumeta japonica]